MEVNASFGKTWEAVIEQFAERNIAASVRQRSQSSARATAPGKPKWSDASRRLLKRSSKGERGH
jgi:hypothetical protein